MRNVTFVSPRSNGAKRFQSTATTWGTLRAEMQNNSELSALMSGDLEYVTAPNNVSLRGDESVLPEGDFRLFAIVKKNKAGMDENTAEKIGQVISKAIIEGARISSEEEVNELKNNLLEFIETHFDVDLSHVNMSTSTTTDPDLLAAEEEYRRLLNNC